MKRLIRLLVCVLALLGLGTASCGGDDETPPINTDSQVQDGSGADLGATPDVGGSGDQGATPDVGGSGE
jgi:hypothetical protein